jgi:hypothetical protein
MTVLGRGWQRLGILADEAWDRMTGIGRGQSIDSQIATITAEITRAQREVAAGSTYASPSDVAALQNQLSLLQAEKNFTDNKAQFDENKAYAQDLGKQAMDAAKSYDIFAQKQKTATEEVKKWQDALAELQNPKFQFSSQQEAEDYQKSIDAAAASLRGAQATLKALRSPDQEIQDKLSIQRQVAGTGPTQRAALQARLTAEDQARHDVNVLSQPNADQLIKQRGDAAATEAILQQTTAISDQNTQLTLNAKLTLATGEAWMKSSTAGAIAAARQQASIEALTSPISVNARTAQILTQQVNEAVTAGAQQVRSLNQQVAAQERLAAAAKDGPLSEHQAEVTNQIAAATQDLNDKLQLAFATKNTRAAADLQAQIARIADDTKRADAAATEAAKSLQMFNSLQEQGYQMRLLQVQLNNVGANDNVQQKALAVAQEQIELEREHQDLTSADSQKRLANAAAIADMNAELSRQKAIAAELPNAFDQAFDRIGEAVTQFAVQGGDAFKSLENIGNAVLSELLQEGLKLSLINPAKNWFAGNNALPTLNDYLGSGSGSSTVGVRNQSSGSFDMSGGGSWLSNIGSWIGSFFADGGIMTNRGRIPINTYSGGGVTNGPQMAIFGENRTPEAYVPVPSGRIPVEMKYFQPPVAANSGGTQPIVNLNFHTKEAVDTFRKSPGQVMNAAYRGIQQAAARNG